MSDITCANTVRHKFVNRTILVEKLHLVVLEKCCFWKHCFNFAVVCNFIPSLTIRRKINCINCKGPYTSNMRDKFDPWKVRKKYIQAKFGGNKRNFISKFAYEFFKEYNVGLTIFQIY
jgi:hypothetical protein